MTIKFGREIHAQEYKAGDGNLYWFEPPKGWTQADGVPNTIPICGPFKTRAEVDESLRVTLLGPEHKDIDYGTDT